MGGRRDALKQRARHAGERGREIKRTITQLDVPWARCGFARTWRELFMAYVLTPVMDVYVRRGARGEESFALMDAPVILVANHSSHMDTPVILRALPRSWRQRTAVLAAADYFYRNRIVATAVSLVFNTVPIARGGGGLDKEATSHLSLLLRQRWNLLLYPEGTRSRSGEMGRLRSGAARLAAEHGLSIIPIYVKGTRDAMPPGKLWPNLRHTRLGLRRHAVEVRFGAPIPPATSPAEAREVTARVRAFFEEEGASGTLEPQLARPPAVAAPLETAA